jgi:hypothetical protein
MKTTHQKFQTKKASALLTAILMSSVLVLLTIGVSSLIINDLRTTADLVAKEKAYFAAEAGIEKSLLLLKNNLPGYETKNVKTTFTDQSTKNTFEILNKSTSFPHSQKNEPKWNILRLNESITVPLFTFDENNSTQEIKNFRVEYFVAYEGKDFHDGQSTIEQEDIDVLRWKIFGISKDTKRTDAISDYFPSFKDANAANPMCLGTEQGISSASCQTANNVSAYHAREHYEYKNGETIYYGKEPIGIEANYDCQKDSTGVACNAPQGSGIGYPISKFLENHETNYLTLTNLINPAVIQAKSDSVRKAITNIYYRIIPVEENDETPQILRDQTHIISTGTYGNFQKTLEAHLPIDQFLPVFNFSLYRTEIEE